MFYILLIIVLSLVLLHLYINYHEDARVFMKVPGMKDRFLIGNALEMICVHPDKIFEWRTSLSKRFNGIYRFYTYPFRYINIYNPEDIEIVLSSTKFIKKSRLYDIIKPWLADGLLLSSGAKWQQRRKILTSAFHFDILRQFHTVIEENSKRLTETLGTSGEIVNIAPIVTEYTLNTICETAMGTKLSDETSAAAMSYKNALHTLGNLFIQRFIKLYLLIEFIYNLSSLKIQQQRTIDVIKKFTTDIIDKRKKYLEQNVLTSNPTKQDEDDVYKGRKKFAFLDLLLTAENDGKIDKSGVQEEVDTFMFGGHDTTASGLSFLFLLLANHQDVQEKVYKEIQSIFGDSTRIATTSDLTQMKYLELCIKESLRLYPPIHFVARILNDQIKLSNYTIPADTECLIHIFDLHRREDLYKNALTFDPDRFLPENSVGRHPYAYIPFSAGPRNCIGQKYAMMEMKSATSAVIRRYKLEAITKPEEIRFSGDLVLRSIDPINIKIIKRDAKNM
ncbi:cytochrome P450 4C1-like [Galleria mellonella]|uniref:Cytochrome P450 4C1-like n=1 Tax=Galleria mellonella TaxID=7137 RepID=A0A6J3C7Z8_GALME|nr:cytochrome P450 4C1-like [Galleria mellonella]XP_052751006.1 cytochrome P450 4C1-like [Galleria mellonella]